MKASLLVIRHQLSCYCGPKDGGKYDLSDACSVCGTGARRVDPMRLPASQLKDRISITLDYEVLIPPRIVAAIRLTAPECLREILDNKTGVPTQFFQLIAERVLPRFGEATTGVTTEMQCPMCKRDGFFGIPHVPMKLSYRETPPRFAVAETYEHFGNSRLKPTFRESIFAASFLIVGELLEKVLADERGVEFVPVSFAS